MIPIFDWLGDLVSGIGDAISSAFSALWTEVSGSIWELFLKWIYTAIYNAVAEFFTSTDQYGGVTYEFRKKWLTVVFREPVTAERSEKLRQQAIKNDPLGKYIKRTARNSENN